MVWALLTLRTPDGGQSVANIKSEVMDALIAKLEEDEGDGPLARLRRWARDTFANNRVEQETAQLAKDAAQLQAQVGGQCCGGGGGVRSRSLS